MAEGSDGSGSELEMEYGGGRDEGWDVVKGGKAKRKRKEREQKGRTSVSEETDSEQAKKEILAVGESDQAELATLAKSGGGLVRGVIFGIPGEKMATPGEEILSILEDLGAEDFEKFKWFLQGKLGGIQAIPKSRLENANRIKTVDRMIETYGEKAIDVARTVKEKINQKLSTPPFKLEDKTNQDIHFIFPFTFRELNVLKEKKFSLVELVHHFFTETKEAGICKFKEFHVVLIFDGLDEFRVPLDFNNTETLTDTFKTRLHQSAVDKALQSPNGHLDLFLRFLLGLSLETNQNLLRGLLTQTGSSLQTNQETVKYIKKKIMEQIQQSLRSGSLSTDKLSPAEWSALVFILLSSEKDLDVFDLKKYSASEEALLRLLPVVKASNKALLSGCNLSERSWEALSSVLSSQSSSLRELDLSNNDLQDSGVKRLSPGLESPHCKLGTLSLSGCLVSEDGCASLASALRSNPSPLRVLDLRYNHPGESGQKLLEDPRCRLDTLRAEPAGVHWMTSGLRKYRCELTVDTNTVSRMIKLSGNNRRLIHEEKDQPYPDHPDRFDVSRPQLLCTDGLTGRCYWEVEWSGWIHISGEKMATPGEEILSILEDLGAEDFEKFKWFLQGKLGGIQAIPKSRLENANRIKTVDRMIETYGEKAIDVARTVKEKINQKLSTPPFKLEEILPRCLPKLKSNLKKKFERVFEGIAKAGKQTLLNQIYTEIYITEGGTAEVNEEHEVRQIETASRKPDRPETRIRLEDIFKTPPGRDKPIRTVLTKGVAGIGKTVLTQKFTLDWAEDKTNQDIHFIFPFTFRELNVLKEKKFSLVELVHHFFTETKEAGICRFKEFHVVLIFDGLDEFRVPLDFNNTETLTDVTESTSVDVLLTNLIRGKLLPSARLWITTRPAAANQIPADCVDMVTEVRGFTDPQKEEYFRKRFREEEQAGRIISHIKTTRSLHIMCHIPVFCWISAGVLEELMETREGGELPKTLTEMYIHFLVVQSKVKNVKYDEKSWTDPHWSPESRKMIEYLGKLAFDQLQKGNLIFYDSDLTECGFDIRAASKDSGVFTQVFREERGLYQDRVFCFVHLSVQEFLAALHVHLTFINSGVNLMAEEPTEMSLYQSAVDKALQSPNGHLDLFLRFLLGLSLETNQNLLRGLLTQTGSSSQTNQETVEYIKKKLSEDLSAERSINLFHCLNELNDRSLVEEFQFYLGLRSLTTDELSPAHWSALVFTLLSSETDLDVFDLKKYSASEEALLRLLPVVKASNKALLSGCNLSERSWEALSSVLSSQSSSLRELDLSNNDLQDSGVKRLSPGLESPHCKLGTLRLSGCNLSEKSCGALSSVLSSQSSSLRELDLTNNDLQDSGVKRLSPGLESPQCKLGTLSLSGCLVSEDGCASLASALRSNPSHLRVLDLSYNHPGDSGQKLLEDPRCRLDTLRVEPAGVHWMTSGLRKYRCELTVDTNTVSRRIKLSDNNRKLIHVKGEDQLYPDHPDRFDCPQLLCRDGLTGRCYWEVEWSGENVNMSVSYRGISRRGDIKDCLFGWNDQSWGLWCSCGRYTVRHNNRETSYYYSSSSSSSFYSSSSGRIGVYVDYPAGILSFYSVSSGSLIHIQTVNTTFTKPLYPGFGFGSGSLRYHGSSVSLCRL
ncbi:NACHT, LRR and PYD domains-containing protein 12-like [Centropristis striata]|uniref:NACHT, LRR and PYD domains-containing protein 12-like n=1 Tax=Centropristis striata TaxID=184440 RepID=UPI0027DEDCB8|nr:NACHT, LRR and PYD domains-containing protein 12-like [Centropristis striata]